MLGDASNGMCGGMVFAVRDFFEKHLQAPEVCTPPAGATPFFKLIRDRLMDSFNLPFGPARYMTLMNPALPDHETWPSKIGLAPHGRAWVMIKQEWPGIKADIDAGHPSPLALVKIKSPDPFQMGKNHQVLAYKYELNGNRLMIYVYDPNHPSDDNVIMSLDIGNADRTTPVTYYPEFSSVFCFFPPVYGVADPNSWSVAPVTPPLSTGNDFWVMALDPSLTWSHLSPIPGHMVEADLDCSSLDFAAAFALVGDFDGDGLHELAVAPAADKSAGNDFWVMKFDAAGGRWVHLSPIARHPMQADFDCSGLDFPAKFAVAGDFDGDGRDEIAIAPEADKSAGNDFWVMKFDAGGRRWVHLSPIAGHPVQADFDCSGLDFPAKFAVAGDFDGDGRDEIAIAPVADNSLGNDFWVMKFDGAARSWAHLGPIPGHSMQADFDCSGSNFPAKFAVAGDFDGDGRDEIAIAPLADNSAGNDFWVMKFDGATRSWVHLSPIAAHPFQADCDCSPAAVGAKLAVVADFDADGRSEIAVGQLGNCAEGNQFWVMKFVSPGAGWTHLADFQCSTGIPMPTMLAVAGRFAGARADVAIAPVP